MNELVRSKNKIILEDLEFVTSAKLPWQSLQDCTFLVTGLTGFLGGFFVDVLLDLNRRFNLNIKVIGLVRDIQKAKNRFPSAESMQLKFTVADLNREIELGEKIDYIVHAASLASPKVFGSNPIGTVLPNTVGTVNLLNFATRNPLKAFLFFSTTGVNGFVNDELRPINETQFGGLDPMKVDHCYLESKRMGENLCVAWAQQKSVPVKIVRPAITFGPGIVFDDGRSYADFIACLVQNKDIELFTDGSAIRNFCYLTDATSGFFHVLLKGLPGHAYNVATDQEITIKDLAMTLVNNVFPEKGLKVVFRNAPANTGFLRVNYSRTTVDIAKLKGLGWQRHYSSEEGFRRTVAAYTSS